MSIRTQPNTVLDLESRYGAVESTGNAPMHVLIVNHYALADDAPGITRHLSLGKELIARGHSVTIVASNVNYNTSKPRAGTFNDRFTCENIQGVNYIWVRCPSYRGNSRGRIRNMVTFAALTRLIPKHMLGNPDVVIGSSPQLFGAHSGMKIAQKLGVPFVMEVRDLWPSSIVDIAGYSEKSPVIKALYRLERKLYTNAAKIITLLPTSADYIESKGGLGKVVWIPNGFDFTMIPETLPSMPEKFNVLYAGAHGFANGLETILEAAKLTPAILYRLIGDGPEKPKLIAKAKAENIENVVFQDPVPKCKIYDEISRASACILHVRPAPVFSRGASPNKLWDYMGMARPVIFAMNSSNCPVAESDSGVLIEACDPQAMAEAATALSEKTPKQLLEIGLRGRQYVEDNNDLMALGAKLEQILSSVVALSEKAVSGC